jgi:hypothetical protein
LPPAAGAGGSGTQFGGAPICPAGQLLATGPFTIRRFLGGCGGFVCAIAANGAAVWTTRATRKNRPSVGVVIQESHRPEQFGCRSGDYWNSF